MQIAVDWLCRMPKQLIRLSMTRDAMECGCKDGIEDGVMEKEEVNIISTATSAIARLPLLFTLPTAIRGYKTHHTTSSSLSYAPDTATDCIPPAEVNHGCAEVSRSRWKDIRPAQIDPKVIKKSRSGRTELEKDVKEATKSSLESLRSLVSGGVGGIFAVVVGHPFDLVKVRHADGGKGRLHWRHRCCAKKCRERWSKSRRLLLGLRPRQAPRLLRLPAAHTRQLHGRANLRGGLLLRHTHDRHHRPVRARQGPPATPRPETARAGREAKYSGGLDVVRQLYAEGGIRSVFRGSAMTLARDGPGSAAYFATYEIIKRRLTPVDPVTGKPSGQLSLTAVMTAGAAAGVAMWIPVFPVDTVKSRLQSAEGNPTLSGTVKALYGKGGFKDLLPGFGPAIARAVPANAATFLGVELAQQAMGKMFG
ncbi:hypothetical protein MRB53_038504 [Persea americana]|nr:hypothetical protein MRB53_038504 [Persea americana]